MVHGSNPTPASRLLLPRLGQPGTIPAFVLPSGDMATKHRRDITVESRLTVLDLCPNLPSPPCNAQLPNPPQIIGERNCGSYNHCTTSTRKVDTRLKEEGVTTTGYDGMGIVLTD
ncbi:hypothetical protein T265_00521 [Opisthorchis viverrini]|uniref:Uncharacterized protein n=1 Tax=Opisthorchis viverrini TaxID=6198 RepID=A0A075ACK4_OPIVI|nr:hypothetical protein T265_00521 [Opisthorchis viverrini]KER33630.1 hypothetical protein T265_00521 [Opisthorchis viverrini]